MEKFLSEFNSIATHDRLTGYKSVAKTVDSVYYQPSKKQKLSSASSVALKTCLGACS